MSGIITNLVNGAVNLGYNQAASAMNTRRAWRYYKKQSRFDAKQQLDLQHKMNMLAAADATSLAQAENAANIAVGKNPQSDGNGYSVSNVSGVSAPQSSPIGSESSFDAKFNYQESQQNDLNIENQKLQNENLRTQNIYQVSQILSDLEKQKADLKKVGADTAEVEQRIELAKATYADQLKLISAQADNEVKKGAQMVADLNKTNKEIEQLQQNIELAKSQDSRDREIHNLNKAITGLEIQEKTESWNHHTRRKALGLSDDAPDAVCRVYESERYLRNIMLKIITDTPTLNRMAQAVKDGVAPSNLAQMVKDRYDLPDHDCYLIGQALKYSIERVTNTQSPTDGGITNNRTVSGAINQIIQKGLNKF